MAANADLRHAPKARSVASSSWHGVGVPGFGAHSPGPWPSSGSVGLQEVKKSLGVPSVQTKQLLWQEHSTFLSFKPILHAFGFSSQGLFPASQ